MKREALLNLYDQSTKTGVQVVSRLGSLWQASPESYLGPGEIVVHLIQANKFNTRWIQHILQARREPFGLEDIYRNVVRSPEKLYELNLRAAQTSLPKFQTLSQLTAAHAVSRGKTREVLMGIPEDLYDVEVSHPLIELDAKLLGEAGVELFVRYADYCAGQIIQLLLAHGYYKKGLLPFGRWWALSAPLLEMLNISGFFIEKLFQVC